MGTDLRRRRITLTTEVLQRICSYHTYPRGIVAALMDGVAPGSYLAISHPAADVHAEARAGAAVLSEGLASPVTFRSRAAIARFFGGLELVEPGLVSTSQWRSGAGAGTRPLANWAGVARKA